MIIIFVTFHHVSVDILIKLKTFQIKLDYFDGVKLYEHSALGCLLISWFYNILSFSLPPSSSSSLSQQYNIIKSLPNTVFSQKQQQNNNITSKKHKLFLTFFHRNLLGNKIKNLDISITLINSNHNTNFPFPPKKPLNL